MGCYGIGPARIAAAAVEQYADEHGICWPRRIAPWGIHLVSLAKAGEPEREAADGSTRSCSRPGPRSSTTTATIGAGEKLPTPSCSAARCA